MKFLAKTISIFVPDGCFTNWEKWNEGNSAKRWEAVVRNPIVSYALHSVAVYTLLFLNICIIIISPIKLVKSVVSMEGAVPVAPRACL